MWVEDRITVIEKELIDLVRHESVHHHSNRTDDVLLIGVEWKNAVSTDLGQNSRVVPVRDLEENPEPQFVKSN